MHSSLPATSASLRYLAPIALESCVLIILSTWTSKLSMHVSNPRSNRFRSKSDSLSPTDFSFATTEKTIRRTFNLRILLKYHKWTNWYCIFCCFIFLVVFSFKFHFTVSFSFWSGVETRPVRILNTCVCPCVFPLADRHNFDWKNSRKRINKSKTCAMSTKQNLSSSPLFYLCVRFWRIFSSFCNIKFLFFSFFWSYDW